MPPIIRSWRWPSSHSTLGRLVGLWRPAVKDQFTGMSRVRLAPEGKSQSTANSCTHRTSFFAIFFLSLCQALSLKFNLCRSRFSSCKLAQL